jgi:hypothetical protein
MADTQTDSAPSHTNLLVGAGALCLVLVLIAYPSAFLLLSALVAVGGLAVTYLGKGHPSGGDNATVQLQRLPRQASDEQQQVQGGSIDGSGAAASDAAQLPPEDDTSQTTAIASALPAAHTDGDSSSIATSPTSQMPPAITEMRSWAAPPSPQQPVDRDAQSQQQSLDPEPVVTRTYTSTGNSQHSSTSSCTVVTNGQAPQTTSSSQQGGMSWRTSGEGAPPSPVQLRQRAQQQATVEQQQAQQGGQPVAGGAAILARLK